MAPSGDKITIALVGGGTIAPLHAQYLLSSSICALVAIIDPFPPGQKLAAELGVPNFTSIQDLLKSSTRVPDAYIVCVPSSLHVQVTEDIINSASPKVILVEKPFCTDSKSGKQLLELAQRKTCQLLVGHHRRFHPSVVRARQVIERGDIGKITAISGFWTANKNDGYFTFADWRCSRVAGGGPIWTNFVHDIDVLHYLTDSRVARVWAVETHRRRSHTDIGSNDLVEEGAAIMLQFTNGVVGTFIVSDNVASPFGWEAATGDNPLYPPTPIKIDSYRIFGTHGTLTEPDGMLWKYDVEYATKSGKELGWNVPMQREELRSSDEVPFQQQAEHLAEIVKGVARPRCSGEDGLNAVRVCDAVISALKAKDGLPITLQ